MTTVSVSQLKAQLSKYLRQVKRGSEVHIVERGVPVARLVGVGQDAGEAASWRRRLVADGVLRPGSGEAGRILREEPLDLGDAQVSGALSDDRRDRV